MQVHFWGDIDAWRASSHWPGTSKVGVDVACSLVLWTLWRLDGFGGLNAHMLGYMPSVLSGLHGYMLRDGHEQLGFRVGEVGEW